MIDLIRRAAPWCLGILLGVGGTQLLAGRDYEVAKPSENIRSAPEGKQIGTLAEGATIEEIGRDGRWIKFRLEGWIWGPSLEGYQAEPASAPIVSTGSSDSASTSSASTPTAGSVRQPRAALSTHLADVRALVDPEYGRFYGLRLDPDLQQVQIRFRVRDLEPEALERRQMRVQHAVWEMLDGDVEFTSIRVETNRADGSGEVGQILAATEVDGIRAAGGTDLAAWRAATRRSDDGGSTWTEP